MHSFVLAVSIVRETIFSLGQNWSTVLRICFLPLFLPAVIAAVLVLGTFGPDILQSNGGYDPLLEERFLKMMIPLGIILLALALGNFFVAIAWHRFAILDEQQPTNHMKGRFGTGLGYLWRSFLLGILWGLCALAVAFMLLAFLDRDDTGSVITNFGALPWPATPLNIILGGIAMAGVFAVVLRLSLILPAYALGHKMTMRDSAALAGKYSFLTFFAIGLITHFGGIALDAVIFEIGGSGYGAILFTPFLVLFWSMFAIALLTVLHQRLAGPPQADIAASGPDSSDMREA